MGKVEMSLQEYDDLKSALTVYGEIVNAITNPCISNWDINWYKEHDNSTLTVTAEDIMLNISQKAQELLTKCIRIHVDQYIKSHDIEGEFQFDPLDVKATLGIVKRVRDSEQGDSEE